jgi:hypothetical protein
MVLCQPWVLTCVSSGMLQFNNISHLPGTCAGRFGTAACLRRWCSRIKTDMQDVANACCSRLHNTTNIQADYLQTICAFREQVSVNLAIRTVALLRAAASG